MSDRIRSPSVDPVSRQTDEAEPSSEFIVTQGEQLTTPFLHSAPPSVKVTEGGLDAVEDDNNSFNSPHAKHRSASSAVNYSAAPQHLGKRAHAVTQHSAHHQNYSDGHSIHPFPHRYLDSNAHVVVTPRGDQEAQIGASNPLSGEIFDGSGTISPSQWGLLRHNRSSGEYSCRSSTATATDPPLALSPRFFSASDGGFEGSTRSSSARSLSVTHDEAI